MPSVVGKKWSYQARSFLKSGKRVKESLAGHFRRVSSILADLGYIQQFAQHGAQIV